MSAALPCLPLGIASVRDILCLLVLGVAPTVAQTIPGAVLARREPHHHLAYEDSTIRVLRVHVPAHDTTLLHEHQADYFWIALGASTVVSARPATPDATITVPDLSFHYTPGKFAHVARSPGDTPFDNITVELLQPQTGARNLCESAVSGEPLDCAPPSAPTPRFFVGGDERPAFATDQLRVSLVTIAPGAALRPGTPAHIIWLIALDSTDAGQRLRITGGPKWVGGTSRATNSTWTLENRSRKPLRIIAVAGASP